MATAFLKSFVFSSSLACLLLLMSLSVGSGCMSLAVNARMLHYRTMLVGSIGKWTTADFVRKYGQSDETEERGKGRDRSVRWVYHLKAEGRRGYDDLTLVFDGDGYLCSWDVRVTR